MSVRSGTRLDGRYKLSDRIAVGGMGEVWRGTDEVLGRSVAIKILRAELAEDDAFRRRFRAEARTAGGLPHNGIAAVFDYGETTVGPDGLSPSSTPVQGDGIAYLVMELVPGEALSTILGRDGALGTERTLSIVAQAARALHLAHTRDVVHRDVKPANLMVTPDGRVKVTDFGIARPRDHEPLTMTGQVMGTAHYLAPELARGLDASALSDVYALGVVAYECLAGHRPFDGDNQVLVATAHLSQQPPPLPGTIAPDVVHVVGAAMEKDPNERIPSAEAFAIALEKLLAHDPTALDGIGRNGGGLFAAQAPAPVPDVPPAPPTRVTSAPAGAAAGAVAGAAAAALAAGAGQAATTVTNPASGRQPWTSTQTAPQGTLLGPGGTGYPSRRDGRAGDGGFGGRSGDGGFGGGFGGRPGDGRPGSPGAHVLADDDRPARRLPMVLIAVLAGVGLVLLATVLILFNRSTPPSTDLTPTPSTGVTTGPTGTTTGTGAPSGSAPATPSHATTKASATKSRTGSPTTTPSATSPSPTSSPSATGSVKPSVTTTRASTTATATSTPSSTASETTPVASGSSTATGVATLAAQVGGPGALSGAAGGRAAG